MSRGQTRSAPTAQPATKVNRKPVGVPEGNPNGSRYMEAVVAVTTPEWDDLNAVTATSGVWVLAQEPKCPPVTGSGAGRQTPTTWSRRAHRVRPTMSGRTQAEVLLPDVGRCHP